MGKQIESFAAQVLATVNKIGGEVTTTAIFRHLRLKTRAEEKKALNALSDLFKAGRVVRVKPAVYAIPIRNCLTVPIQERMWRVLRIRRSVTVADLQELAGASMDYAEDWLRMLHKREVVRRDDQPGNRPSLWTLVNDTVTMPDLDDNAAKLRDLRANKALQALDQAATAINEARQAVMNLTEEGETHA